MVNVCRPANYFVPIDFTSNKKGALGEYPFIMYVNDLIKDELVSDALRDLHAKQGDVKFMGSYPAAGEHSHTTREHADARWREADDWVAALKSQCD